MQVSAERTISTSISRIPFLGFFAGRWTGTNFGKLFVSAYAAHTACHHQMGILIDFARLMNSRELTKHGPIGGPVMISDQR
jgi:hypothetical protein